MRARQVGIQRGCLDIFRNRAIQVGIETPAQVEVLSGLARDELVIVGNRSQLRAGQKVEAKLGGVS